MVGADVPGGPPPARTRRDVQQPSRAWAWGAGGRAGRAPLPMSGPLCARANQRGRPVRTPRAEGGSGTSRAGMWVGGCGFGRGWGVGRGRCRARPRQARPSRVVEGVRDVGFHVGTVPPGRYTARRRAKYPRRPRRGTSKRARHRARPRQARPSRVAEGVGDAGFHVGTVPPGQYAARRRAKYPRHPRRVASKQGLVQGPAATRAALPCGRGAGDAGFHVGAVPK